MRRASARGKKNTQHNKKKLGQDSQLTATRAHNQARACPLCAFQRRKKNPEKGEGFNDTRTYTHTQQQQKQQQRTGLPLVRTARKKSEAGEGFTAHTHTHATRIYPKQKNVDGSEHSELLHRQRMQGEPWYKLDLKIITIVFTVIRRVSQVHTMRIKQHAA